MAHIKPTSSRRISDGCRSCSQKKKCIVVYERRKKLKEKVIREETPEHEKDKDEGANSLSSIAKGRQKADREPD